MRFSCSQGTFFFCVWISNLYSVLKTFNQVEGKSKECVTALLAEQQILSLKLELPLKASPESQLSDTSCGGEYRQHNPGHTNRPAKSASSIPITLVVHGGLGGDQQQVHPLLQCLQHLARSSGPRFLSTSHSSPFALL